LNGETIPVRAAAAPRGKRIVQRTPAAALAATLPPVLQRIYAARQVTSSRELECSLEHLAAPAQLKDIDRAVALLYDALRARSRILIVADFDADGATSCAVAVRALRLLGAADVRYVVPNRFQYGYGLTPEIVAVAAQESPDLLITVDNGIASHEGVAAARALGMRVLITDHHLPGEHLPAANAIVNPNQPGCPFPSKHLAGVGVIFYVMLALRAHLREQGWFEQQWGRSEPEPQLAQLLDLVALGTVADVVPLDHHNRILVAQGLARINGGRACAGIHALLRVAGRTPGRLVASDLGFCVGPRLNAAGRLTDMSLGIACLLADDEALAAPIAAQLDGLNRERRALENDMQQQAWALLETLQTELAGGLPKGLCLFREDWHQGVIGILAGRLKDRLHRPVIAFAPGLEGEIKGSARSVAGLHIRDALDAIATRHPGLLQKFGGHAMAAGMSLRREHFDDFRLAFDAEVGRHLSDDDLEGRILSDGPLAGDELALDTAEAIRHGGPWGQGFPEPVFDGRFDVLNRRVVGERHLKLVLRPAEGGRALDAIVFNFVIDGQVPSWKSVHAAYRLDVNEYQGQRALQLVVEHLEAAG
jgi:single-stranded-DNA-specific exonuclease